MSSPARSPSMAPYFPQSKFLGSASKAPSGTSFLPDSDFPSLHLSGRNLLSSRRLFPALQGALSSAPRSALMSPSQDPPTTCPSFPEDLFRWGCPQYTQHFLSKAQGYFVFPPGELKSTVREGRGQAGHSRFSPKEETLGRNSHRSACCFRRASAVNPPTSDCPQVPEPA